MQHEKARAVSPPWADGPYSVKRHGNCIQHCDAEPIRTPGCIPAHGALPVLRPSDLTIRQVGENSAVWLGLPPEALPNRPAAEVVGLEGHARLRECLDTRSVERNPLHVFTLPAREGLEPLDVSVHTSEGMAIVEFEASGRGDDAATPDCCMSLKNSLTRLHAAPNLADFCRQAASEFRDLTGLDRVMVYRFHPDLHGEVYAESRRDDLAPWLGLHYPAEDILRPVREIFTKIWIRPLADAHAEPTALTPLLNPDTGLPPDLTYCALRGASTMYVEYLRNMGVSASLTMPILKEGELWGLIACHHCAPTRFSYRIRAACEFLAQAVSLQIKSVEDREHLLYRLKLDGVHGRLVTAAVENGGNLEALIEGSPNLLDGLEANGVALLHRNLWRRCGETPDEEQLEALAQWLERRPEFDASVRPIYVTDALSRDYPKGSAFAATASGLLAMSLSRRHRLLLLWFRPETVQTVRWAGNPHDMPTAPGPNGPRLTPRVSFESFVESVRGRSLPWKETEISAALHLRRWAMELVIDRNERLAELNADLARSDRELDTFAYIVGYDLKEPLRGIARHARRPLDNGAALDEEQRRHLDSMMRLTQRMDTLLNMLLHFSKIGRVALELAPADLNEVVEEALKMTGVHMRCTDADIRVARPLPASVCDRMRVREVFCCLIDNALRYNDRTPRRVEIGCLAPSESSAPPSEDERPAVAYYVRDNGIGIEPHNLERAFDLFRRLHGRDAYGGGVGAGLAIARMSIERHHGRIWAESIPGAGSTFYFTLGGEPPGPS